MLSTILIVILLLIIAYILGYLQGAEHEKEIALIFLESQGRSDPAAVKYRSTKKHKKKDKVVVFREKPKKVSHNKRIWPARHKAKPKK